METEIIVAAVGACGAGLGALGMLIAQWVRSRGERVQTEVDASGEYRVAELAAETADKAELWATLRNTQVLIDDLRRELGEERLARVHELAAERQHCEARLQEIRAEMRKQFRNDLQRKLKSQAASIRREYEDLERRYEELRQRVGDLSEPEALS